jgi:hypothetical protein
VTVITGATITPILNVRNGAHVQWHRYLPGFRNAWRVHQSMRARRESLCGYFDCFPHAFFYCILLLVRHWSYGVVDVSIRLASDVKLGQHLKVCTRLGEQLPETLIVSWKNFPM